MLGSGLLVMKCSETMTTIVLTDFSCQSSFSPGTLEISSVGNLHFCTGRRSGSRPTLELKLLLAESLRRIRRRTWLQNIAPCRWKWIREGSKCCPRGVSWARNLEGYIDLAAKSAPRSI